MRRPLRIGLAAGALVLGVVCLLLAQDVRGWRGVLDTAKLEYSVRPLHRLQLSPSTALPGGVSASVLSVGGEQKWLHALQTFSATYDATQNLDALGPASLSALGTSADSLTQLTQSQNPALASQAYDLLAVVLFREAYPGSGTNTSIISEAVLDLEHAVALDPANEFAKENLELALRTAYATHAAVQFSNGAGNHIGTKRAGGAGPPPGEGY